ncbi:hypothetical protein HZS_3241 [Henneguya salminicola]|nr:hypothetical protein HZS_3241 [Henneguya salminicola]
MSSSARNKFKTTPGVDASEDYESVKGVNEPQPTYPPIKKLPPIISEDELPSAALLCRELREKYQTSFLAKWAQNKKWTHQEEAFRFVIFMTQPIIKRFKPNIVNSLDKIFENLEKLEQLPVEIVESRQKDSNLANQILPDQNSEDDDDYIKDHFVDDNEESGGEYSEGEPIF